MKISVVIPNYNSKHLLEKNLPQVIKVVKGVEIVVVDDGSTDGSVEFVKKHFPQVKLIEKVTNSGFATTVNLGFKAATGDIVVLLNTDVVPQIDFLKPLVKHFADPQVFAVGCLDLSFEGKSLVKRGRGIGRFERGLLVHSRGEVDQTTTLWASGGSSAFCKRIWENLGGFDEIYNPFYWEDIDICYRAQKSGYQVRFEPKSIVEHYHQEGAINKKYSPAQIRQISYRNQWFFFWKNITDRALLWSHLIWLPVHLTKALLKPDRNFWRGFLAALITVPRIIEKRSAVRKLFVKSDREIMAAFI